MQAALPSPSWIDEPAEWPAFCRPISGAAQRWESSLAIEGMVCAACALKVESALRAVPGVVRAEVMAASRRARVVWQADQVLPSRWLAAVRSAGYRAIPLNDLEQRRASQRIARLALWRWLVAALCMMQVMMYAYPAYVAAPGEIAADQRQLMRWASWLLTLPLLLFSCQPFLAAALRDIRHRRIGMDLPVALGIVVTFCVSSVATFNPDSRFGQEVYFDSLAMFVFFLLTGRWLESNLRDRTTGAIDQLLRRLPDGVERLDADGHWSQVARHRLAVGDTVRVRPGETIPVDGLLLEGSTQVNESLLTGESRPLRRAAGSSLLAGSLNLSATVLLRATAVAADTRFGGIVALMESAALSKPDLAQLADRLAPAFLFAVLMAAAAACAFWWPSDPGHALMVAVAVLVVTCPCALSLATPAAMLASAGALARQGTLVRRLQALQTLAKVDTVVFDKTGTLTGDAMALAGLQVRQGISEAQALAMAAALARQSLHPVSRALVAADAHRASPTRPPLSAAPGRPKQARTEAGGEGTPVSAAPGRPKQARTEAEAEGEAASVTWQARLVAETAGQGLAGRLMHDGGDWPGTLRLGSAAFCGMDAGTTPDRIEVCLSDARGWLARFTLAEQVRPDARLCVQQLQTLGIEVRLLSGDRAEPVQRLAAGLGIGEARGVCTPQDKLNELRGAQDRGHVVAMVGDGLNDGPVLAAADVSFAFGDAVPLAQAQADFTVLGDQLQRVVDTFTLARRCMAVVRQNLIWALLYNALCIPLAMVGWLPAWLAGLGMALSSLAVVLNALRLSSAKQEA